MVSGRGSMDYLTARAETAADHERRRRRRWKKARYRNDAAYRANELVKGRDYKAAKRKRCPEFATLERLRSRVGILRERMSRYQEKMDAAFEELLVAQKKVKALAAQCRGK